jgi:DNA-directed RNA polymerase specialized sigma24 family protein
MPPNANPYVDAPLSVVAGRCAEETAHFHRALPTDPSPCFELFRRALAAGDQQAWDAVFHQYEAQVRSWVENHLAAQRTGCESCDYVNDAFDRLRRAVSKAKFEHFSDLRAVLAYLKMCVHSAIMADVRRRSLLDRAVPLDDLVEGAGGDTPAPADAQTERVVLTEESRRAVREAVHARLQGDKERLVVHALYDLDLKPRAIYDLHPGVFADVHEIYRIRQVVLERLSRDPALKALAREGP